MNYFLCLILLASLSHASDYPLSDHYDGDRFFNPGKPELKSLWDVLKWKVSSDAAEWPRNVENQSYPRPTITPDQRAVVTFINHATFLVQLKNLTLLTDPIFSQRASPVSFAGPERVRAPGIKLEDLPAIDVVIISHNHYDHLDLESLKQLEAKSHPLFLVPLGDQKLLQDAGIQNVKELDWWQEVNVKEQVIVFTPAQHWSARGVFDRCKSLWGGYMVKTQDFKLFFAGDTGYSSHFRTIAERLGAPDLSLLPIGAYAPRWFMQNQHMDPDDAVKAHKDLQSVFSLGMHFGTFQLTDESISEPVDRLKAAQLLNFIILDQGESRSF